MTRAQAFEVVRSHGGTPSQTVTRQTNVLVVGELGWPLLEDGRPSNKLTRAASYGIPVVSERRFLEWIGKAVPDLNRTYSAGQIATLSKLSHGTVEELAALATRPLTIPLKSNSRVDELTSAASLCCRSARRPERKVEAEAALRAATRADPTFAEAWYNLSDLVDEQGRSEAAIDCLRKALRAAPAYIDAVFNLALLLQRRNKYAEAAEYWRQYLATDAQSEWAARALRSLKFCEMQVYLSAS